MAEDSSLTVVVETDVPTGVLETVKSAVQVMWGVVARMLEDDGLQVPSVRLVVTDDVIATAEAEGKALGLPSDRRVGSDRLGGVVGGKALAAEDRTRASVIVGERTFRKQHGLAELCTATVIAHEFGHLYYGALRDKHRGVLPNVWLAWEVAGMLGLLAAEEYRVNRFSVVLAEQVVPLKDGQGHPVLVSDIVAETYTEAVTQALPAVVPGLVDTVWDYRVGNTDLETMWSKIVRTSEEITLLLAHADGHASDGAPPRARYGRGLC